MRWQPILIISIVFCISGTCRAQLEADNWMFSYSYYVNFGKATIPDTIPYPGGFQSSLLLGTGSSSYSDRNGNLLFYAGSSGIVWDRNFQPFPSLHIVGGMPLSNMGNVPDASQTVLAVPYPGHDSLFILFHMRNQFNTNTYYTTLFYSIISMKLRGGLGEIIPGQRDIPLLGGAEVGFKLTAVLHCNKKDIWVIGHLLESDKYFSYLITNAGITSSPVYFTGTFIPKRKVAENYFWDYANNNGSIKVAAQGNRLAAAFRGMGFIELFDFNAQTGVGTNLKKLNTDPPPQDTVYRAMGAGFYGPSGVDFSASGDRLYATGNYDLRNSPDYGYAAYLYQFDATQLTESAIQASRYRLDSLNGLLGGAIQIGNNGKMYANMKDHLFQISNPENLGAACNYNGLTVFSGVSSPNLNLPTYLQSYFRYPMIATGNCQFQNISFSILNTSGVSSILWNFGEPSSGINNTSSSFTPTHIYSTQGAYEVTAILYNSGGCGADTIRKLVYTGPFRVFLGNDTTICEGDTLRLRINIPNASNLWSTGSTDTLLTITGPGRYWIQSSIGECTASDTINVYAMGLPTFTLGPDKIICADQSATLAPIPNVSDVSYTWSNGSTSPTITVNTQGSFWLELMDKYYGCIFRDSISIQHKNLPGFTLGNDTSICENEPLLLNVFTPGAQSYSWSNGHTGPSIHAGQSGIYWAEVLKDGCTFRDSIGVTVKVSPAVYLGQDTILCAGNSITLNAGNLGYAYLWKDGSVNSTYEASQPDQYWVKVTNNGCHVYDTIEIEYLSMPSPSLGADKTICPGEIIMLNPGSSGTNYSWQDGSSDPTFSATSIGMHYVDVTNRCGSARDSIILTKGICELYIPSAFTPNNDGLNDVFKPLGKPNVNRFNLSIYNRWGEVIFRTTEFGKGWDGRYNGTPCATGIFVWVIVIREEGETEDKLIKGKVTLIR